MVSVLKVLVLEASFERRGCNGFLASKALACWSMVLIKSSWPGVVSRDTNLQRRRRIWQIVCLKRQLVRRLKSKGERQFSGKVVQNTKTMDQTVKIFQNQLVQVKRWRSSVHGTSACLLLSSTSHHLSMCSTVRNLAWLKLVRSFWLHVQQVDGDLVPNHRLCRSNTAVALLFF